MVLDKLDACASVRQFQPFLDDPRFTLITGDITDEDLVCRVLDEKKHKPQAKTITEHRCRSLMPQSVVSLYR